MRNTPEQTAENGFTKASKSDEYTPWYTIWTVALFFLAWVSQDLDRIFTLYVLLIPILILPALEIRHLKPPIARTT